MFSRLWHSVFGHSPVNIDRISRHRSPASGDYSWSMYLAHCECGYRYNTWALPD